MMNLTGVVSITKLKKISDKMTVGTVYCSYLPEGNEEWVTTFIDCKIVGQALKQLKKDKVVDKDKIEIESAILRNEVNGKYTNLTLTIFKAKKYVTPITDEVTTVDDGDTPF